MKVQISKLDNLVRVTVGFITVKLDIEQIDDNVDTILHFIKLLKLPVEESDILAIKNMFTFFRRGYQVTQGCNYSLNMFISKETGKIQVSECHITEGSIDIIGFIKIMEDAFQMDKEISDLVDKEQSIRDQMDCKSPLN